MSKTKRAKPVFAFAIKTRGMIGTQWIYPFTADGREDALRNINRPAGQSVIKVRISEVSSGGGVTLSAAEGRGK